MDQNKILVITVVLVSFINVVADYLFTAALVY
jgi:hypothetical protein